MFILNRTINWVISTLIILVGAHRIAPWPVAVFSVVVNVLLLSYTHWYPMLFLIWYTASLVIYVCSKTYRGIFDITIDIYDELLN